MRYIALEEAFFIPELAELQPMSDVRRLAPLLGFKPESLEKYKRRLTDFTEYRLPEMDDTGIDIQVLSLTVPRMQVDVDAERARDNARFANDYLAKVIGEHPDRFRGFAALPLQDPAAAAAELERAVMQHGLCGALVNDCITGPGGRYLDAPAPAGRCPGPHAGAGPRQHRPLSGLDHRPRQSAGLARVGSGCRRPALACSRGAGSADPVRQLR
jgi:2,3-dihydroxybenzoate decarboxylase